MSTDNICFYEEIRKISLNYHQIHTLFLLLISTQIKNTTFFTCHDDQLKSKIIPVYNSKIVLLAT